MRSAEAVTSGLGSSAVSPGGASEESPQSHLWKVLSRGASASLVTQVSGAGISFVVQILLARLMPLEQYGVYIYVLTCTNLLVIPALAGFDKAAIKYVAAYRAGSQPASLAGFVVAARRAVLLASVSIAVGGAVLVWAIHDQLATQEVFTALLACVLLPLISQVRLTEALFRGLKQILKAGLYTNILRPASLFVLIGILFVADVSITPTGVFGMLIGAALVALIIAGFQSKTALQSLTKGVSPVAFRREWLAGALPLLMLGLIGLSLKRLDILMLGALRGVEDAGTYSAAARTAELATYGLTALNAIVAPLIAEAHSRGDKPGLQRILKFAAYLNSAAALTATLALIVLGRQVLGLFGDAFVTSYNALLILLAAQLVNACLGPVGFLMTMTRYQYQAAAIFGSAATINLLLNALFIPRWGFMGAAGATALSIVWWNVGALIFVFRRLNVNPTIFQLVR